MIEYIIIIILVLMVFLDHIIILKLRSDIATLKEKSKNTRIKQAEADNKVEEDAIKVDRNFTSMN